MNIGLFALALFIVMGIIYFVYSALVWFAAEAERQCAIRRERSTRGRTAIETVSPSKMTRW